MSMKISLLINVKMPTVVGMFTFTSRKNSILCLSEPKKKLNCLIFSYLWVFKIWCSAGLSMKNFYDFGARFLDNQILHLTLRTKQERSTHTQIHKCSRTTHTVNRISSASPNRWSFSYPNWKQQLHLYLLFLFWITQTHRNQYERLLYRWPYEWLLYRWLLKRT